MPLPVPKSIRQDPEIQEKFGVKKTRQITAPQPVFIVKKGESECLCMPGAAKIQTRNTLVSWYNRENEATAVLEKEGKVSQEDIEVKKIVLEAVKHEIEKIDDTPICEDVKV